MLALLTVLVLTSDPVDRLDPRLARAVLARRRETAVAAGALPPRLAAAEEERAALVLARMEAAEPSVEEIQAAAVAHAGIDPPAVESWRGRARLAPLLPRISAEYRHDERTYRVVGVQSGSEVDYLRSTPGDTVGIRASWNLDELVFSGAELKAAATAAQMMRRREELVERVTRLYYERRRMRVALALAPPSDGGERAQRELDIEAATARLDAMTGGLFASGSAR